MKHQMGQNRPHCPRFFSRHFKFYWNSCSILLSLSMSCMVFRVSWKRVSNWTVLYLRNRVRTEEEIVTVVNKKTNRLRTNHEINSMLQINLPSSYILPQASPQRRTTFNFYCSAVMPHRISVWILFYVLSTNELITYAVIYFRLRTITIRCSRCSWPSTGGL